MNILSKMTRVGRALLLASLAIITTGALQAQSGTNFFNSAISTANQTIDLGNASGGSAPSQRNWAIFALSGGVTITDPVATYGDPLSYDVLGNVAIAGTGNLSMTASWIKGRIWVQTNTQSVPASGAGFYTGTKTVDPTYLTTAVSQANAASTAAANSTPYSTGLVYGGALGGLPASISLTAAASITGAAATTYVINLTDLILSGSAATLTLNGTDTTNYIFNVSRFMTLSNLAKIQLGGSGPNNITQANVLFNVKSNTTQYDVSLSGGSEANGIILAPTRNVKLTGGSKIFGEVIAKGVSLSGVSKVINPFASP